MNVHEKVYRSLLVMYPKGHRREYGEPMVQLVRDRFRDEGGGVHTVALWCEIARDLARSVLTERTEVTMNSLRQGWWRFAAVLISTSMAVVTTGNLFGNWIEDGTRRGKIQVYDLATGQKVTYVTGLEIGWSVVALVAAALVFGGIAIRRRHLSRGSVMIGVGVLPAVVLILAPWFPLLAAAGVLAGVVAVAAFASAAIHYAPPPDSQR